MSRCLLSIRYGGWTKADDVHMQILYQKPRVSLNAGGTHASEAKHYPSK